MEGEVVLLVRQQAPDGWLVVQSLVTQKIGLVPQSYVNIMEDESDDADAYDDSPTTTLPTPATLTTPAVDAAVDQAIIITKPAGVFGTTAFYRTLDIMSRLRAQCAARNLPLSVSDNWRALDLRQAMDDGINAAQQGSNVDTLLQWQPLAEAAERRAASSEGAGCERRTPAPSPVTTVQKAH